MSGVFLSETFCCNLILVQNIAKIIVRENRMENKELTNKKQVQHWAQDKEQIQIRLSKQHRKLTKMSKDPTETSG